MGMPGWGWAWGIYQLGDVGIFPVWGQDLNRRFRRDG